MKEQWESRKPRKASSVNPLDILEQYALTDSIRLTAGIFGISQRDVRRALYIYNVDVKPMGTASGALTACGTQAKIGQRLRAHVLYNRRIKQMIGGIREAKLYPVHPYERITEMKFPCLLDKAA